MENEMDRFGNKIPSEYEIELAKKVKYEIGKEAEMGNADDAQILKLIK